MYRPPGDFGGGGGGGEGVWGRGFFVWWGGRGGERGGWGCFWGVGGGGGGGGRWRVGVIVAVLGLLGPRLVVLLFSVGRNLGRDHRSGAGPLPSPRCRDCGSSASRRCSCRGRAAGQPAYHRQLSSDEGKGRRTRQPFTPRHTSSIFSSRAMAQKMPEIPDAQAPKTILCEFAFGDQMSWSW